MTTAALQNNDHIHDPVMINEMIDALTPVTGKTYIDGTFGAGGYTRRILDTADCHVIAIDRDPDARARYDAMPADLKSRITFIDGAFSSMQDALSARNIAQVDGIVLDLGVSSPQIDTAERGFSFRMNGPLDMRMDPRVGKSAADVVNTYAEKELADIIYKYGDERQSRGIARAIVAARQTNKIETTNDLSAIIRRVVRKSPKDTSDPSTRTFQALRIYVNDELGELSRALNVALSLLRTDGRLVIVTFHSLEDRIVKDFFRDASGKTARGSRHAPATTSLPPLLDLIYPKPLSPTTLETTRNPRARSAHLRAAIRTDTPYYSLEASS